MQLDDVGRQWSLLSPACHRARSAGGSACGCSYASWRPGSSVPLIVDGPGHQWSPRLPYRSAPPRAPRSWLTRCGDVMDGSFGRRPIGFEGIDAFCLSDDHQGCDGGIGPDVVRAPACPGGDLAAPTRSSSGIRHPPIRRAEWWTPQSMASLIAPMALAAEGDLEEQPRPIEAMAQDPQAAVARHRSGRARMPPSRTEQWSRLNAAPPPRRREAYFDSIAFFQHRAGPR